MQDFEELFQTMDNLERAVTLIIKRTDEIVATLEQIETIKKMHRVKLGEIISKMVCTIMFEKRFYNLFFNIIKNNLALKIL